MSEPAVDMSCMGCFDARGEVHRLDRAHARVVRERDEAYTALADLLRVVAAVDPRIVDTPEGRAARRALGEIG